MLLNSIYEEDHVSDDFLPSLNVLDLNITEDPKITSFSNTPSHMENVTTSFNSNVYTNVTNAVSRDFDWTWCFDQWLPPNHFLFQLANAFLFLSYLAPVGIHGLLYLRTCLMIGSLFFALWGWIILCALDTFLWNAVFTVINFIHVTIILYILRPVKFSGELERVYRDLFQPLRVSRHQFKKAIHCMREIKTLKPREPYCVENVTKVDRLSLVLSGRLVVSQHGHALHIVDSKQFLDSPEWFGVCTNDNYQVSITALEECRLLVWHRDKLKLSISNDTFLQAVFDNILGKDVVKKLLLVSETSCNGVGLYVCEDVVAETTKLLSKNKQGQTGLSVLLSRQVKRGENAGKTGMIQWLDNELHDPKFEHQTDREIIRNARESEKDENEDETDDDESSQPQTNCDKGDFVDRLIQNLADLEDSSLPDKLILLTLQKNLKICHEAEKQRKLTDYFTKL